MSGVPRGDELESAAPPTGARILAFFAILLGGLCGGLIGYSIVDLQYDGTSDVPAGIGLVVGAAVGSIGVAVVAVLVMRAMGEWRTIQHRAPDGRGGG